MLDDKLTILINIDAIFAADFFRGFALLSSLQSLPLKLFCVPLSFHNHYSGSPIQPIILLSLFTVPDFVPNPLLKNCLRNPSKPLLCSMLNTI